MVPRLFILAVCIVLVVGKRKPGGGKRKPVDSDEDLKANLESCSGGNMHFYFHGDSDGHDHQVKEDDHHVHVHVHTSGDHSMHGHKVDSVPHVHKAICDMHDPAANVDGYVKFNQMSNAPHTDVKFDFIKLGADNAGDLEYTAHVHFFGDLSEGCSKLGDHFDPYDADIDVGDLGTISSTNGQVNDDSRETFLTLFADHSVVGRSVVIHAPNGDPVACCVIGWSIEDYTDDLAHFHMHDVDHSHHDSGHSHDVDDHHSHHGH